MDRIVKQSWWQKNKTWVLLTTVFITIVFLILFLAFMKNPLVVELDKLRTGKVEFGDFQEIVLANGSIEPKSTVLIDANEGGTIKEIKSEEGEMISAGDILVTLTNESLMLDYMQRETQMVEQINNLRNTRINLHQNLRTTEDQLEEYTKQFKLSSKKYQVDSSLYAVNGLAKNQFLETSANFEFLQNRLKTLNARKIVDNEYHSSQISRIDNSIVLMERNLELIREKLNEMSIKAPISGQLNSFNLEPGQVLQANQTIGRIDVPGKFSIRALVDQHYLNRLSEGQRAFINYNGIKYNLKVTKVLSTIENGQIELYLEFENKYPPDLRRGQNFQVFVIVSAQNKALKLPRGSFFSSSGGKFVYILKENRTKAYKHFVQFGRQNPKYYEVIDGLSAGEEVIISSYEQFKTSEEIEIKK